MKKITGSNNNPTFCGGLVVVNERAQHLANEREDERVRHLSAQRISIREAAILEREHSRMTERRDLVDLMDDTGFAPGSLI